MNSLTYANLLDHYKGNDFCGIKVLKGGSSSHGSNSLDILAPSNDFSIALLIITLIFSKSLIDYKCIYDYTNLLLKSVY